MINALVDAFKILALGLLFIACCTLLFVVIFKPD